jgi:hypothetical protein
MTCLEIELRWSEHGALLKKYQKGQVSIGDVLESAKRLPPRCTKSERDAEKRGRAAAEVEADEIRGAIP